VKSGGLLRRKEILAPRSENVDQDHFLVEHGRAMRETRRKVQHVPSRADTLDAVD
jgi:hypothetical protein